MSSGNGFKCEECEEAVFLPTTRSEATWLRRRQHVVREVASHTSGGLDAWMMEGLEFLDRHAGHDIIVVGKP